jgi:integrase
MGTEAECRAFAAMIRRSVPKECIRTISRFYPNRRAGQFSTEGRIYLEFEHRVICASLSLEGNLGAIKAVSLQLRHASVAMTERYYARINCDKEVRDALGDQWRTNPIN